MTHSILNFCIQLISYSVFFTIIQKPGFGLQVSDGHTAPRIGLNLGVRTYFSAEDTAVGRLAKRPCAGPPNTQVPMCQAEGCKADLSTAKHYHRRHKVCELHSKAPTVIAAGLTKRFCQQCSRYGKFPSSSPHECLHNVALLDDPQLGQS